MAFQISEIKNLPELLKPILSGRKYVSSESQLLNAPGENYGSLMVRLDVKYEEDGDEKVMNMVAKLSPPNEWIRRMFATDRTFKKEVTFYLDILPLLRQFQLGENIAEGDDNLIDIFPRCLGARLNLNNSDSIVDEDAVLLLENLKTQNYATGDRMVGFNLEESVFILKNLARFHALPLAYRLKHPKEFKELFLPMLNKINIGQEMFDEVGDRFIESINKFLCLAPGKYERFQKGMFKGYDFQREFPSGNELYATTVHRDFWTTNTMILKDGNTTVKNKIVDFQVITYGAPASDLVFFLYTSIDQRILEENYDYFLKVYHDSFVDCLEKLNVRDVKSRYSFESFLNEVEVYGPLEASHILIMLKAVFADKESVKDMTDFGVEEMFNDDGITDVYKKRLNWTVDEFFKKNWL